jgi:hypothetical protein
MLVILSKIKNQTGESTFPATLHGKSSGNETRMASVPKQEQAITYGENRDRANRFVAVRSLRMTQVNDSFQKLT